jgi:hypothetical protein
VERRAPGVRGVTGSAGGSTGAAVAERASAGGVRPVGADLVRVPAAVNRRGFGDGAVDRPRFAVDRPRFAVDRPRFAVDRPRFADGARSDGFGSGQRSAEAACGAS